MAAILSSKKSLYLLIISVSIILISSIQISAQKLLHDKEFDVNSGQALTVDTPTGNIFIRTWDEDILSVKIYGNRKAEDKVTFEFNETGDGVEVLAEKPNSFFNWFISVKLKYEILVPEKFDLKLKTSGGDILVSDVEGRNEVYTSGGDIKLRNLTGELKGKTSGGDIEVDGLNGNIDLRTSGGDIDLQKVRGDVSVGTSGGDIEIMSANGMVEAKTSGGDIKLNYRGENNGGYLSTSGGDIDIFLEPDFSADVEFKTSGGDIEVDFPNASIDGKIKSSRFKGKFNNGGKEFGAKTSGGDITVRSRRNNG